MIRHEKICSTALILELMNKTGMNELIRRLVAPVVRVKRNRTGRIRQDGGALPRRVFLAAERSLWHMGAECCHLTDSGQKSPAKADSDISALRNQAALKECLDITVRACSVRLAAVSKQIGLTARNTQASSDCVGSRGGCGYE